jgi:Zn-dependent peptidase ImmA (M78 family)/DNA-binding Xre family transcriptional regulator
MTLMPDKNVNQAMVTLAREAHGLTQTELAQMLGISQAMLSKIEAGVKPVTDAVLDRLCQFLNYPESFFLQTDTVFGPGLSEFFHRRRQDVSVKVLARVHAQINIIRMHIARLLRSVEIPEMKIRPLDMADFDYRPQDVARAMRAAWQIPEGPIANVIRVIEDAGGIVIRHAFGTPQVDAISRWVPGLPPLFYVNAGLSTDRERMSLCHELGHLLMHDMPNEQMEVEANQFAAEFLMPERDVSPHLDRISIERLAALKPYWRVSMAALLFRATELRKVSTPSSRFLWSQMSQRGLKRREPAELDLAPETPTVLRDIIDLHRTHYGYNIEDLAKALASNPSKLMATYQLELEPSPTRTTLRLVKA